MIHAVLALVKLEMSRFHCQKVKDALNNPIDLSSCYPAFLGISTDMWFLAFPLHPQIHFNNRLQRLGNIPADTG